MRILLTGGGSGGHITPLLAVAHKLKALAPDIDLVYVGDRGSKFNKLTASYSNFDEKYYIFTGKFRRYYGESWLKRFADTNTNALNVRDGLFVLIGFWQALWLIVRLKPDLVFIKGGSVGVPIGLAAALCRVPYITHDSDTLPGLTNRIIGRWARLHATGMPIEFYPYPAGKTRFVGVPVGAEFRLVTLKDQKKAKTALGIPNDALVLVVTGGSQGSQRINKAVEQILPEILEIHPKLHVIHHVGHGNENLYGDYSNPRLRVEPFIEKFQEASAAADLVIARSSATTIAELGIQAKPVILIPSPFLAGGHQLKNAEHLKIHHAAVVVPEAELIADPQLLLAAITSLLNDSRERQVIASNLSALSRPNAAQELAELLLETARNK